MADNLNILQDCPWPNEPVSLRGVSLRKVEKIWLATQVIEKKWKISPLARRFNLPIHTLAEYVHAVRDGRPMYSKRGRPLCWTKKVLLR